MSRGPVDADVRLHWPGRRAVSLPDPVARTPLLRFGDGPVQAELVFADAAAALSTLCAERGDGFADLVYLDPPFGTGDAHGRRLTLTTPVGSAPITLPAYDDAQPLAAWLEGMERVLRGCHRALAPHGTLYLHIDWRRGAHLRLLLDEIFGTDALRNEIVWAYGLGGAARDRFARKHDTILSYARDPAACFFRPVLEAATSSRLRGQPKLARDVWTSADAEPETPIDRAWPDPVFELTLSNRDPQRTGYPTQKPDALADRIVAASLPDGGLLLEPMAGSGALGAAALRRGGRALLVDRGAVALDTCRGRCAAAGVGYRLDVLATAQLPTTLTLAAPLALRAAEDGRVELRPLSGVLRPAACRPGDRATLEALATEDARALLSAWGFARRADDGGWQVLDVDDQGAAQHRRAPTALTPRAGATHVFAIDLWGGWHVAALDAAR
ncbi:MAG: hypothetical protein RIT45_298 [Pseudomonadota bacterium]